jgi:hypothetical protein
MNGHPKFLYLITLMHFMLSSALLRGARQDISYSQPGWLTHRGLLQDCVSRIGHKGAAHSLTTIGHRVCCPSEKSKAFAQFACADLQGFHPTSQRFEHQLAQQRF